MPRLANDRNEQYCRHRARGMNASKAAMAAGYAPGSSTTHLEKDPEIVARIEELTAEFRQKQAEQRAAAVAAAKVVGEMTGVGRAWVIEKLAENALNAAQDGDYKESNSALKLIGDEFGMFQGQKQDEGSAGSAVPPTLNMDALESVLDSAQGALPQVESTKPVADPALAFKLIEGQGSRQKVMVQASDAEEGEAEHLQDGWTPIGPQTSPEAILAMIDEQRPASTKRRDNRVAPHERRLSTGSETDVALHDDDQD
jgi:hypothetical protein